jgi:hypothetical protein
MLIETVLSMLTVVCHAKKMRHRLASYFQTHVGLMVAAFNLLVSWFGLQVVRLASQCRWLRSAFHR